MLNSRLKIMLEHQFYRKSKVKFNVNRFCSSKTKFNAWKVDLLGRHQQSIRLESFFFTSEIFYKTF